MKTKTKLILGLTSALAVSATIYFGFIHKFKDGLTGFKKLFPAEADTEKAKVEEEKQEESEKPKETLVVDKKEFPMYEGSRGKNVTKLQEALQIKFGQIIANAPSELLGKNTILALKNAGYGVPLSKEDFDKILAGERRRKITSVPKDAKKETKVYAKNLGTSIWNDPNDIKPLRLAGKQEYLGTIVGKKRSYVGNEFAAIKKGDKIMYVAKENITLKS